jgi:hypothetical protein
VVQLFFVVILLAVQLFASLFYMSTALVMWGPFMTAPLSAKVMVGAIVSAPILGFLAAYGRIRIPKIGTLATVGVVTLVQVTLVFAFAMTSGGQ